MIINQCIENEGNKFDYNQFSSNNQDYLQWKGEEFNDFAAYQSKTGNDTHSKLVHLAILSRSISSIIQEGNNAFL